MAAAGGAKDSPSPRKDETLQQRIAREKQTYMVTGFRPQGDPNEAQPKKRKSKLACATTNKAVLYDGLGNKRASGSPSSSIAGSPTPDSM